MTGVQTCALPISNGRDYDHSFIDNYIDETEDQMDEEDFIESGHKRDIEEIIELLK